MQENLNYMTKALIKALNLPSEKTRRTQLAENRLVQYVYTIVMLEKRMFFVKLL